MKFTALTIDKLPEGTHKDFDVPGLALRVGKKRRTWVLRYVGAGKKQETDVIGHYVPRAPEGSTSMGLAAARAKAKEILARVDAGVPVAPEPVQHPKEAGETLEKLIDDYEKARLLKGGKGMKTLPEALRTIRRVLKPYLALPARQFSKADLRKVRDELAETAPQMSSRFIAYFGTFWRWAMDDKDMEHDLTLVKKTVAPIVRERVLSEREIRKIWHASFEMESDEGKVYGRLVRFLLCVPVRISEGRFLVHGKIIDGGWTQEAADNKAARKHRLMLPALALEQLGTGKADELCFEGKVEARPIGGISKFKAELDKLSGVKEWRHHDARRSISSYLQDLTDEDGEPLVVQDTITALLNHGIKGADKNYLHGKMLKAKGRALGIWETELRKILGIRAEIIPFPQK